MKNASHNLLYASCFAAGLFAAAAGAQAADLDVSQIQGRAAPTLTGPDAAPRASSWQNDRDGRFQQSSGEEQPVTTRAATDDANRGSAGVAAAGSTSSQSGIPPTGEYLAVEEPPERFAYQGGEDDSIAYRREGESLGGTPLVEGRGMREGRDFTMAGTVTTERLYGVEEILGRASPPAPAHHPDYMHVV